MLDALLVLARQIIDSNQKCQECISEKQQKLGIDEYTLSADTIVLKPGGREVTLKAIFFGQNEGCEIVLDVDREIVRSVKNYLGRMSTPKG